MQTEELALPEGYELATNPSTYLIHIRKLTGNRWLFVRKGEHGAPAGLTSKDQAVRYARAHARLNLNYDQLVPEDYPWWRPGVTK